MVLLVRKLFILPSREEMVKVKRVKGKDIGTRLK